MKSNKLKWPLLILCLSVWGAVFYVLFADETPNTVSHYRPSAVIDIPETNEFNLSLAYSDPFLGSDLGKRKTISIPQSTISTRPLSVPKNILENRAMKTKTKKNSKSVQFPKISYKGYVQSVGKNIALVDLDGQGFKWEKGYKKDGIHLMSIHFDSIRISKEGVMKTVFRE